MTTPLPTNTTTDERDRDATVAVLPIGSFEQHGPHLPLTTDTLVACAISHEIARVHPVRLLPPITISCSHEHSAWPGTVSISAQTLAHIVTDVYQSLTFQGMTGLVLINGHGGNYALSNVVQQGNAEGKRLALFPAKEDWNDARTAAGLATTSSQDMHAGELETSLLLHVHPDLVRFDAATDHTVPDRRHFLTTGLQHYAPDGTIGHPTLGTPAKGRAVLDALTKAFPAHLRLIDQ